MTDCTIALSNGPTFTRTFIRDPYRKHQINAVSNCFDGVSVHSTAYSHDLLSRRTNIIYKAQTGTNMLSCVYNARSEVTGVSIDTNDYAYIYDNIGNNLYTSLNAVTNAYTVNNLNQYKAITNQLDLSGLILGHDADGNTSRIDGHSLFYDAENRLASYMFGLNPSATGTVRSAYLYDHYGRRVSKLNQECREKDMGGFGNFTYWHTNDVTTFVYDGWNLIHERVAHTNGTVDEIEYVWGLDLSGTQQGAGGVGGLLFEKRNGVIYIPCYDANGNVTSYVDETGVIRAYRVYDAFGNTIAKGGDMVDAFHFWYSTKYLDHETGLYYYGYRYYSPMLQRWINRDPIEEEGGKNVYGYCLNNSFDNIDILGEYFVLGTVHEFSGYPNAGISSIDFDIDGPICVESSSKWRIPVKEVYTYATLHINKKFDKFAHEYEHVKDLKQLAHSDLHEYVKTLEGNYNKKETAQCVKEAIETKLADVFIYYASYKTVERVDIPGLYNRANQFWPNSGYYRRQRQYYYEKWVAANRKWNETLHFCKQGE